MSKNKETAVSAENGQSSDRQAATQKTEREMVPGKMILTASTREDLLAKVDSLRASLGEDRVMTTGAIGRSRDNGTHSIRVEIY